MKNIFIIKELDYSATFEGEFINICVCDTLETARIVCLEDGFDRTLTKEFSEVWTYWVFDESENKEVEITRIIQSINYIES